MPVGRSPGGSRLRGDLVAGVAVASYLVPQVMAYSSLAGVPASAGLWAAVASLLTYALCGSSRRLSVGPESSTALLSGVIVGSAATGPSTRPAALASWLAVVLGSYCVLAWFLRLGFFADLLSRPVLVGYMAGLAVVMVVAQLGRATRVPVRGSGLFAQVRSFAEGLGDVHAPTLLLAVGCLVALVLLRRWWSAGPVPLLVLAAATAVSELAGLPDLGVQTVGALDADLPSLISAAPVSEIGNLLLPALGLLLVAYADNILTARAFAHPGEDEVDAGRELLALGAANVSSGLVGGFPVSSSASRTALGVAAGSRTQLHSVVCAATVSVGLWAGSSALEQIPLAALAALVLDAAVRLLDLRELRRLARFRRSELWLALVAALGVVSIDVLYGVLVAAALSIADMLKRIARPHDAVLGSVPGLPGLHDIKDHPDASVVPGLVIYRYDSPLFFANAEDFRRRALATVDDGTQWFVLNMEAVSEVDITGLDALDALRRQLVSRGVVVAVARAKHELLQDLAAYGLLSALGPDRVFSTLPSAVTAFEAWRAAVPPGGPSTRGGPRLAVADGPP